MYDTDLNIDWIVDTYDEGRHLNWLGAKKVSECLGEYLKETYNLTEEYDEQWNTNLVSYQKVCKIARLELERDFIIYINKFREEFSDKVIFISASDDMAVGLSEEDVIALRSLGLRANFSMAIQNSYIAVIENGEVVHEALSNRPLEYTGLSSASGKNTNYIVLYGTQGQRHL